MVCSVRYSDQAILLPCQQQAANRTVLDTKQLLVDIEVGRTLEGWIPRRLGGCVHDVYVKLNAIILSSPFPKEVVLVGRRSQGN